MTAPCAIADRAPTAPGRTPVFPRAMERGYKALSWAAHRPKLAPHVDQMKSASNELAKSHPIVTEHRRPGVRRQIPDLIHIPHMEMLHRALLRPIRSGEVFSTICCSAPYLCCYAQSAGLRQQLRGAQRLNPRQVISSNWGLPRENSRTASSTRAIKG